MNPFIVKLSKKILSYLKQALDKSFLIAEI